MNLDFYFINYFYFIQSVNFRFQVFKIAFEYNGIQHSQFPNPYHRTLKEYLAQRSRDNRKYIITDRRDTIIIILWETRGFDRYNLDKFQDEITRQLEEETGIKLPRIGRFAYDASSNSLKPLVSKDIKNLEDKYLGR